MSLSLTNNKPKRIKVLIHNRAGGQRRLVEVDARRTLVDLEDGLRRGFNLATPLTLSIDNVDLAGSGTLEEYGLQDFTILEMRPTEKLHGDTIITLASIGLESRTDISRSFFVQNVQFLGLKEPALPETVLEKIASTTRAAGNKPPALPEVPLIQERVSSGTRQVAMKVWDHFRSFGGIERCVVQQTGMQSNGDVPVLTAHAIVTMNSMESYHRAMAHHQMSSDQKNIKSIEFGAGSMGIEVQYRPTFRNLGNVVLIRFIRGKDGSVGQAERKGILTPGDLLVGVGHVDVRGKDLKTVRSLIKDHGRPLTLYFREPPDTSEFTSGSHANRVTVFPCIALGDDTPLSTEFNLMHARSAESVRTDAGTRKKKDVGLDDDELMGLDSDFSIADTHDQQASATEAESAAMAAMIAAGNMGTSTFQVVDDADTVDGHTDSADVVFKAAPLSVRWATLRKAERLWVAHQTLSKVFSRGVQIRAHPQDMRSVDTRRSLADVVVFGARNNNDDDEEQREPYLRKFSIGVAGVTSSASREDHNLGRGTKNIANITRRSSVGDVPLKQLPFDVARSLSVKMIVQKNLPHWLLSAIEALPPEWQAVERPAPIKEQTAAEAAAARKERMQETQKKMQEGFKKATDGFVSGFLGFGNKLKSMAEESVASMKKKPSNSKKNVFAGFFARRPSGDESDANTSEATENMPSSDAENGQETESDQAGDDSAAQFGTTSAGPTAIPNAHIARRSALDEALLAAQTPIGQDALDTGGDVVFAGGENEEGDAGSPINDDFFAGTTAGNNDDGDEDDFFAGASEADETSETAKDDPLCDL